MDSTTNPAGARVLVRPLPPRRAPRPGRDGRRLPRHRPGPRPAGRRQAVPPRRQRRRRCDQRHESEARVLAGLNHPGLVAVYDIGTRRRAAVPRDGAGRGRDARGPGPPRTAGARAGRLARRAAGRLAPGHPRRRGHPPRRQAGQRAGLRRGRRHAAADQADRLRHRPAGRRHPADLHRPAARHGAVPQPRADHRRHRLLPERRLRPRAGAAGVPHRSAGLPRGRDRDRRRAAQPPARGPGRARRPVGGRCWGR